MLITKLKQLAKQRARLAALEKDLATERATAIRDLHVQAGYSSRDDLITALTNLEGPNRRRAGRGADDEENAKRRKPRKPRAVVTDKVRKGVVAAVKAGGTNQAVAERFGLSSQTVHNIKAAAGLVNRRK